MSTATDNTWTHVASRRRPAAMGWGEPTIRTPAPAASTTRPGFSFSSSSTVSALEGRATKKPTAAAPWKAAAAPPAAPKQPDLSSLHDFPSLGGSTTRGTDTRYTVDDEHIIPTWAKTVKEMVAREDVAGPITQRPHASAPPKSHRSRLAMIGTRCFDDGPADYDGPEEDDDGAGSYCEERAYDVEGDEFNAELAVSRRAGDNSDW
jgi:hypothetical protein